MSVPYFKKYAKKIMIYQDLQAVKLEREVEKLLYEKENMTKPECRRLNSQKLDTVPSAEKLKPAEYPVKDLLAHKDRELVKTEVLFDQLRQEKAFVQGKLRKPVNIRGMDPDEIEAEFEDARVVNDYIGVNTREYNKQKRDLKHTKYRLANDFEEAEEKLTNLTHDWKVAKDKKKQKPLLLEYNNLEDVEKARQDKSKEILKMVEQVKAANEAIKRRLEKLKS